MDNTPRSYEPYINHMTQPDTIVPDPGNPQALNRYSCVLNNPIRYTDPTGHWIDEGGGVATNKKKNAGLKIVAGRRVGNSDGDGTFVAPTPPEVEVKDSGKLSDEDDAAKQLRFCLDHPFAPECDIPAQVTLSPLQHKYDFVGFWELNHLDAWGFRFGGSRCFIVLCARIDFDLFGNSMAREATLFATPSVGGLGWGYAGSLGVVAVYDAPYMDNLAENVTSLNINITPGTGAEGSYGVSESPNATGNYAQTYYFGISLGEEYSGSVPGSVSRGYSIPIFTLDEKNFYIGLK